MMCKNDERMKYNYVMNEEGVDGEGGRLVPSSSLTSS